MIVTGIYGGSFNPIHIGHTSLGVALCKQKLVDELWFLVSPHNPLKENASLMADALRLHLAKLAVDDIKREHGAEVHLGVSDFEMHLPRPSYMVDTLAKLREAYPEREFVLVIGADNWLDFHKWREPDTIMAHHRIIVYPRPGYDIDASTLPQGVTLANTPLIDISSTEIRQAIANDPNYDGHGLLPSVWKALQQ